MTEVDSTVQRIGRTYEVRGLLENITSYSSPIVGQGTLVNDVQRAYNSFEQATIEYQEHSGAVNTSTSVNVQYAYADGSSNTIRPTAIIYPNGRNLYFNYGTSGGIDDALSRVASLIDNDGTTHLADYTRIGADTFVQQSSPQPQIAWSLINGTGIDPYSGLDQFDRVVDNRWYSTATNGDLDRIQHGYDRASNRLWRRNTVAEAVSANLDELYANDGLYRLAEMQRGQLNASGTAIVTGTLNFGQAWGLDATGNWQQFWQNDTGVSWNLQQTRTASKSNEITAITGGWAPPGYDAAGNMTQMPQPNSPLAPNSATYDAWNRMMSTSSGGSPILQNAYDGDSRRVTKLSSGTLRHYYFAGSCQSLEERLGSASSSDRQFVTGLRYGSNIVLRDRGAERLYALQDLGWNVTAICAVGGSVAERYMYAPYGMPTFLSPSFAILWASAYDWETLFAGFRRGVESGLYDACDRYFQPSLGFWVSTDGTAAAGRNMYLFRDGNPPSYVDTVPSTEVDNSTPSNWPEPLRPNQRCKMYICCGPVLTLNNVGVIVPYLCKKGPKAGLQPCHCFVRVTNARGNTTFADYHGWYTHGVSVLEKKAAPGCCDEPALMAVQDVERGKYSGAFKADCKLLSAKTVDCARLRDCLEKLMDVFNLDPKRCYGECACPNSNTVAYGLASFCGKLFNPDANPTPKGGLPDKNCNGDSPGYGQCGFPFIV